MSKEPGRPFLFKDGGYTYVMFGNRTDLGADDWDYHVDYTRVVVHIVPENDDYELAGATAGENMKDVIDLPNAPRIDEEGHIMWREDQ